MEDERQAAEFDDDEGGKLVWSSINPILAEHWPPAQPEPYRAAFRAVLQWCYADREKLRQEIEALTQRRLDNAREGRRHRMKFVLEVEIGDMDYEDLGEVIYEAVHEPIFFKQLAPSAGTAEAIRDSESNQIGRWEIVP